MLNPPCHDEPQVFPYIDLLAYPLHNQYAVIANDFYHVQKSAVNMRHIVVFLCRIRFNKIEQGLEGEVPFFH